MRKRRLKEVMQCPQVIGNQDGNCSGSCPKDEQLTRSEGVNGKRYFQKILVLVLWRARIQAEQGGVVRKKSF
jgi:hypothetical protein